MDATQPIGTLAAALALVLPGAVLVRRDEWRRTEPVEIAAVAFAASASYWAVAIWCLPWLAWAGVGLRGLGVATITASVLVLGVTRRAEIALLARAIRTETVARVDVAIGLVAVAARVPFPLMRLAGAVGDLTAHATMTELIVLANGMPTSHEPLLAISTFGQVAPGFHALSALVSTLSGTPSWRAILWVMAAATAALSFALAAVLRTLGVPRTAAAAAAVLALLLARNPQFFQQWGAAPTLLAAAIALIAFREIVDLVTPSKERGWDARRSARLGFLGAGVVLCHVLPAVSLFYMAGAVAAVRMVRARPDVRTVAAHAALAALVAAVAATPWVLVTPLRVTPEIAAWAHDWFREEASRALAVQAPVARALGLGAVADTVGPATGPSYVIVYLGALASIALAAGFVVRWARDRASAAVEVSATMVVAHLALFAGGMAEWLPLWSALYPTRTALWLAVPLAVSLAALMEAARSRLSLRACLVACGAWSVAVAVQGVRLSAHRFGSAFYETAKSGRAYPASLLANEAALGAFWITTFNMDNSAVGTDDLRALAWVRENTPPDAVFATNAGDCGGLVTPIAHRRILEPHYYWFHYRAEFEAWRRGARADHVFVASQVSPSHRDDCVWRREDLDRDPRFVRVHTSGGACVYRAVAPK